jgi:hypothetical protein
LMQQLIESIRNEQYGQRTLPLLPAHLFYDCEPQPACTRLPLHGTRIYRRRNGNAPPGLGHHHHHGHGHQQQPPPVHAIRPAAPRAAAAATAPHPHPHPNPIMRPAPYMAVPMFHPYAPYPYPNPHLHAYQNQLAAHLQHAPGQLGVNGMVATVGTLGGGG